MNGGLKQQARLMEASDREAQPVPCQCGICGRHFQSKGERRRHRPTCRAPEPMADESTEDDDPEGYQRWRSHLYIRPEHKARAAAEWDAMDEHGRLPEGWEWKQ